MFIDRSLKGQNRSSILLKGGLKTPKMTGTVPDRPNRILEWGVALLTIAV